MLLKNHDFFAQAKNKSKILYPTIKKLKLLQPLSKGDVIKILLIGSPATYIIALYLV
jgi:hypothetical protein